jgi:CBS domain-containing protein
MVKEKIRRLPVVDDEHRVVGLISLCDIIEVAGSGRKKSDVAVADLVAAQRLIAESHKMIAKSEA